MGITNQIFDFAIGYFSIIEVTVNDEIVSLAGFAKNGVRLEKRVCQICINQLFVNPSHARATATHRLGVAGSIARKEGNGQASNRTGHEPCLERVALHSTISVRLVQLRRKANGQTATCHCSGHSRDQTITCSARSQHNVCEGLRNGCLVEWKYWRLHEECNCINPAILAKALRHWPR